MNRHACVGFGLGLALGLLVAALPAQTMAAPPDAEKLRGAHGLTLPGSFIGELPAASGPGIAHQLDLWPDQVFQLRRTWLGRGAAEDMLGRWHIDPERRALVLDGPMIDAGATPAPQFEIMGNGNLRLLDQQGQPITSSIPYTLARNDSFTPIAPRLSLRGMFLYFADAARFTDCTSGRSWPVAMEGDFLALQRAYLTARAAPQAPLMAMVEGTITPRPPMEGDGTIPTLVVDRFISVTPGERCEERAPTASLRNTYWRIVTLDGESITAEPGRREPHLLLREQAPRYAATVGCNQLIGGFETSGSTLRFTTGASTMMACPPPLDVRERTLAAMLGETTSFRLEGQRLALLGADGRVLIALEAVYLR